jgi:type I restriction enzyme S subunit
VKYVCRFAGGGTPDKGNIEYWNGEIPWVSPKDMKSSEIVDTEDHITKAGLDSSATKLVEIGAVLIVMRSGILRHSIPVAINRVPVTLNQDMRALIPAPILEPRYLARLIEGHQHQLLDVWSKEGTTVESLESDLVADTEIAIPPLIEQRAIADYLDRETARLDGLVAAKERVLGLVAEKRRALITHAVTRGFDSGVLLRDSGIPWLGEIPAHWEVIKLKHIAIVSYGVSDELDKSLTSGTPLISLPNVDIDGTLSLMDLGWADLDEEEKPGLLLKPGDLLFNWRNGSSEHLAKTAYFDAEGEFTHVGFLLRIRFDLHHFESRFYQALLNALRATGFFLYSRAMVNNTFNQTELGNLSVVVPPLPEQRAIVAHISAQTAKLDALRLATERTIALLKERRAALIAAAVTGQIDLEDAA